MKTRALCFASIVSLVACSGGEPTSPTVLRSGLSSALSDGANGGNSDFWFLSPLVDNPNGNPLYLDHGATTTPDAKVSIRNITSGLPGTEVLIPTTADKGNGQYQLNWRLPDGANQVYRIFVFVGDDTLGFADVRTASSPGQVKNATTNDEIVVADNRNLPIRFVIEQFALCEPAGTACSQETINLTTGGEVTIDIPGYGRSGVTIPPQGQGGETTITLRECGVDDSESGFDDMNPAVTDLPTYGPCLSVNADPPLAEVMGTTSGLLINAATVFICDITVDLGGMTHDQQERITMHRWDDAPGNLHALPHAPHVCTTTVSSTGMRGFLANVRRGALGEAGRQLLSFVSPRPLYAAAMLDVGGGGFTFQFSAFQFALPARLTVVGDNDFDFVPTGSVVNPTVLVTDLGGDPVEGATVRFVTSIFECDPNGEVPSISSVVGTVVTPVSGQATTPWTISSGEQVLYACGRGLAGNDINGPRQGIETNIVDPFQPLSTHFGDASNGPEVLHQIGSVQFFAFGDDGEIVLRSRGDATATVSPARSLRQATAVRKTKPAIKR